VEWLGGNAHSIPFSPKHSPSKAGGILIPLMNLSIYPYYERRQIKGEGL
jgi:hypothetical protein